MLEKDLKKVTDGVYPFHMPGHKRQKEWLDGLFDLDITEIEGADDLHAPTGIIAHAQQRAAELFGTQNTIFLTGGSTCGILAAISNYCEHGDSILVARNCHRSVYNACRINGLNVSYIYPLPELSLGCYGAVAPWQVAEAMDESNARIVVITSPTYEGIVSDIKSIAHEVHRREGLLIVDSAHGAHLGFNGYFPDSARHLGADVVVESAHKTLPCLTGAALLHLRSGSDPNFFQEQLGIFETSSPSYPILCSIDRFVSAAESKDLFSAYADRLKSFYTRTKALKNLRIFRTDDPSKLIISVRYASISGFELKKLLREKYLIEFEMAMPCYAVAMTSLADTDEGFERLISALFDIDAALSPEIRPRPLFPPKAEKAMPIYIPRSGTSYNLLPLSDCLGRISSEFIFAYPPGSPIITPGEVFSAEMINYIDHLSATGAHVYSSRGDFPEYLWILAEKD